MDTENHPANHWAMTVEVLIVILLLVSTPNESKYQLQLNILV